MSDKIVVEGYVYEYCHADDCHIVILPRKITEKEIERLARKVATELQVNSIKEFVEDIVQGFQRQGYIHDLVFWEGLDKEAFNYCDVMEKYKGKKVRINIEVIK